MARISRTGRTVAAVALQTAPTPRCPAGQQFDPVDKVCRQSAPARLVAAPVRTRRPAPTRCPPGQQFDPIDKVCRPVEPPPPGRPWPPREALPPRERFTTAPPAPIIQTAPIPPPPLITVQTAPLPPAVPSFGPGGGGGTFPEIEEVPVIAPVEVPSSSKFPWLLVAGAALGTYWWMKNR